MFNTETHPLNHTGFTRYLNEHRLMGVRCAGCGSIFVPPRALCSRCYSTQLAWEELSGEGELIGFTTVYVGLPALAAEGYTRDEPYCTGVVRLKEGPILPGFILGFDCAQPEAIPVGLPVRAVFVEKGMEAERKTTLAFRERKSALS